MNHEGTTFLSGCWTRATLFCAKEGDRLAADGRRNSVFIGYRAAEEEWQKFQGVVAWTAIAMAAAHDGDAVVVVAASPAGDFWEMDVASSTVTKGKIEGSGASLRSLRTIDRRTFAVGMGRVALERAGTGEWLPIGPPGPTPKKIVGFEDLDGFGPDDLYAVGWRGEIWRRAQQVWQQIESPTTTNLNALCCAADGKVYVVGDKGVLLVGRDERWTQIDTKRRTTLQDVAEHGGKVYCVSDSRIFKLVDDQLVEEEAFVDERRPATCLHLVPTDGALLSLGPKDVFVLRDGSWRQVV